MENKSDDVLVKRISESFKRAREIKKVTRQEMSASVGLSKNHISKIERGLNKPSVELLLGYCKKLDMTPDEILVFMVKNYRQSSYPF